MRHVWRTLRVAVAIAVTAVPIALADPAVAGFIESHKIVATYYPLAAGVVYALYRAVKTSRVDASDVQSNGSSTMRAGG